VSVPEIEPNLVNAQPGRRLYDGGDPAQAARDAIAVEQRALAIALRDALRDPFDELSKRLIEGLAPQEVFVPAIGLTQAETAGGKMIRIDELARGGVWKLAGALALGDPGNTADVTASIDGLAPGFLVRLTAKRTDPVEATPNLPIRTLDGTVTVTVAGGAAADRVLLFLRLQRTGARLGGGSL
jgi:hypothetical protein